MASTAACTAIGRCRRQTVAAEEQNVLPAGGETFQADGNDGWTTKTSRQLQPLKTRQRSVINTAAAERTSGRRAGCGSRRQLRRAGRRATAAARSPCRRPGRPPLAISPPNQRVTFRLSILARLSVTLLPTCHVNVTRRRLTDCTNATVHAVSLSPATASWQRCRPIYSGSSVDWI